MLEGKMAFSSQETELLLGEQYEKNFELLPDGIKSGICGLKKDAANSLVTQYLEKQIQLGKQDRLSAIDDLLNGMGVKLVSFRALHGQEDQENVVACLKGIFSDYTNKEEKEAAKEKLEDILG